MAIACASASSRPYSRSSSPDPPSLRYPQGSHPPAFEPQDCPMQLPLRVRWLTQLLATSLVLFTSFGAWGAPEAKILRIDPLTSLESGHPIITTVIEISQSKRVSDAVEECARLTNDAQLACMSEALEKPNALYTPFPFPAKNAVFLVSVDDMDRPAKYLSHTKWGDSGREPGVGTAWLILIDADQRMGPSFVDARQLAARFVAAMGPNDIVNL